MTFAAYLIQDNKYIREYCIKNLFVFLADKNVVILIAGVIAGAFICFGIGTTIDYVRFYIFRQLRLKDRIQNLETKLENYLSHKFFRNK